MKQWNDEIDPEAHCVCGGKWKGREVYGGGGNTEDAARLLPFEEQDEVFPFLAWNDGMAESLVGLTMLTFHFQTCQTPTREKILRPVATNP